MSLVMEETMSKLETARILATGAFLERTSISEGNLYDETHLIYKLYKYFFPEDELGQAASYLTYLGDEESVLERLVDLLGTELVEVLKIANGEASGEEEEFYTQLLSSKNLTALRVVFVHYVFVSLVPLEAVAESNGISISTWFRWRIKYRFMSKFFYSILTEGNWGEPISSHYSDTMRRLTYLWADKIDRNACGFFRNQTQSDTLKMNGLVQLLQDDEQYHLVEDEWYMIPWGADIEKKLTRALVTNDTITTCQVLIQKLNDLK